MGFGRVLPQPPVGGGPSQPAQCSTPPQDGKSLVSPHNPPEQGSRTTLDTEILGLDKMRFGVQNLIKIIKHEKRQESNDP